VSVALRDVPAGDPLGSLRGQDNMLVYRTRRYSDFPLVIRGPGAGAEVTAAGVLGDVLRDVVRR
jgi:homoserine dehydrogenase